MRALAAILLCCALIAGTATTAAADEWIVAPGASGGGSAGAPFGSIQAALQAAHPGDVISVRPGTYAEALTTVRGGADGASITLRAAEGAGSVVVTASGQVLRISHPHVVVEGLVLDGQYGAADAVKVTSAGSGFVLRDAEIRRSGRDCLDMAGPTDVLLERSTIHHCLWWKDGRQDAHAVVAGPVRRLTLRDMTIHTFSGDGLQLDPGRSLPGWDDVRVEQTTFRLEPLPAATNGFAKGVVPGENAVDTKTHPAAPRARMTIRQTTAEGFGPGLINNMAAFNLKEQVHVTVDGVTVSRSEVAFRVRGPGANGGAWVDIRNAVVHDVAVGIRYEDDIEHLSVAYATIGRNVGRVLHAASSGWSGVDIQHTLIVGTALPAEAPPMGGNFLAPLDWFVDASAHDYRLQPGAAAIDSAVAGLVAPPTDRQGTARPQGPSADAGAYERTVATTAGKPSAPTGLQASAHLVGDAVSVTLTWTDTSATESEYQVLRSVDAKKFGVVATLPADTVQWADLAVARAARYWYRVRAVNAAGRSGTAKATVDTP